jgi:predicted dehydrogenase
MEPLNLMLVGCGMMGARHLRGYGELARVCPGSVRLRAVCDPQTDLAEAAAKEAEELLGYRPPVFPSTGEALAREPEIEAADIVTGNRSHDAIAIPLFEAGLHCLVEKPLGLTVARGRAIIEAAKSANRILATAENNRRDPMNRLMQHVCQSGLIGAPNFVLQTSVTAGRRVIATPWRHSMAYGGLALDVGIHQGYILEMILGPIDTVCANSRQVLSEREWQTPGSETEQVPVESDDVFSATLTFRSGAQGAWVLHFASAAGGAFQRHVFGDLGTAEGPSDRSGGAVRVRLADGLLEGDAVVEKLPEFELNKVETRLFGERPGSYSFESPVTDRKLIAAEVADFIDAIRDDREPEVPGELGLRSVAIIYALLESAAAGRPVRVADVLSGAVCDVQDRVEQAEP